MAKTKEAKKELKEAEIMKKLLEEEIVKRNMERIKKLEIKETEIEGMFNEEIEAEIMKMNREEKKLKEAKNIEKMKEAEIIKKIRNMIKVECLERVVVEIMRKEAKVLNIEKIKEEEKENTSSMASDSTSRTKHSKIGSVRRAAATLFDASMERCDFSNIKRRSLIFSCTKEEYGDYTCDNVLRIWPKLREIGTKLQGPKDVGKEIKRNLLQSDMIEGTPSLHGAGFLSFKISGKWIAKRIHRMLIEGIETWAPEVLLERAIVTFPSLDIAEGMHMDMLRCRYICRSLTRMFQYCQVEASHMDLARNIIKIEERGELVIYSKAQGGQKSFVKTESGQGLGNASKDLGALRYGVEKLNAQWLLYVTPVAKKEYIEMCITAAKDAGWLSNAHLKPPYATYVGYRSCTTKLENLIYKLNKAKALHKVASFVLRGHAANYSARDVLECAIQYTFLKTPRMADCTFNVDEILDEHGDTFLYLLNTQARIQSITNKSRNDISELKNVASELKLEKDDLLMKGEERDLALQILDFAEVLQGSCFSVLPHLLCKYLYNLSEIFNRYFVSTVARGRRSIFPLLLCEATRVVMDTCFHLLEITPQSFKNELGVTRLLYGAQLSVEPPIDVGSINRPPRIPNTRFEPFSINLRVNPWDCKLKVIKVFGYVDLEDSYGLRSEGWTLTNRPDVCYVGLFRRPWTDPVDMINGGCLSFGNPSCSRSVPFSSSIGISMDLTAVNEKENDLAPICKYWDDLDLSRFRDSNLDGSCGHVDVEGEGGQARIHYILLKDAVDATIEITFSTTLENLEVSGEIVAYYEEGFPCDCDVLEKTFYMASLFEVKSGILKSGPIRLQKSQMAVPRKGSLKVQAYLIEVKPWRQILSTFCVFPSQTEDSSQNCLEGTDCSFQVKVNWSYVQDEVF